MEKIKSIKGKIASLVAMSVVIAILASSFASIRGYGSAMTEMIENNMVNYVTSLSRTLDTGVEATIESIVNDHFLSNLYKSDEELKENESA